MHRRKVMCSNTQRQLSKLHNILRQGRTKRLLKQWLERATSDQKMFRLTSSSTLGISGRTFIFYFYYSLFHSSKRAAILLTFPTRPLFWPRPLSKRTFLDFEAAFTLLSRPNETVLSPSRTIIFLPFLLS